MLLAWFELRTVQPPYAAAVCMAFDFTTVTHGLCGVSLNWRTKFADVERRLSAYDSQGLRILRYWIKMALKGMEAYMESDEEGDVADSVSSYSPVSTEGESQADLHRRLAQDAASRMPSEHLGTPRALSYTVDLSQFSQRARFGFPQCIDLRDEEKVRIPDDTPRACSASLEDKVAELIAKQKRHNLDVNYEIQKSKAFRNPSIYQKLIEYCDIDEFGTNFDKNDFDHTRWTEASSMESLAKAQSLAMEKYERERKAKGGTEPAVKRKTKWDSEPKPGIPTRTVGQGVVKVASAGNLTKSTK